MKDLQDYEFHIHCHRCQLTFSVMDVNQATAFQAFWRHGWRWSDTTEAMLCPDCTQAEGKHPHLRLVSRAG